VVISEKMTKGEKISGVPIEIYHVHLGISVFQDENHCFMYIDYNLNAFEVHK